MSKRRNRTIGALLILLVVAACAAATPALAEPRACRVPDHLQRRLQATCSLEKIALPLVTEQGLELTQVMVVATGKEGQGARYCAIYTLGELRDPRAAELLKAMLHDPDPNVRRMAAHGLGKQGDRSAVMPLVEVLCRQRERVAVRSAAAASLGKLGDRRAVGMLTYCAGDRSGWMRSEALKALSQMEQAQQMQRAGR